MQYPPKPSPEYFALTDSLELLFEEVNAVPHQHIQSLRHRSHMEGGLMADSNDKRNSIGID